MRIRTTPPVRRLACRVLIVLAVIAGPAVATDFFVAPHGQGDACSRKRPCSLLKAQTRVRTAAPAQREDLRVNLLAGTYLMTAPLALIESGSLSDSGHNGFKIVWQAAPGELAILSGGTAVTGWALFDAAKNIWRADAPAGFNSRQLYVNGRRATRPITNDLMADYSVSEHGFMLRDPLFNRPIDISQFHNLADIEVVRLFNWQLSRCNVTAATAQVISVHPTCFYNSRTANLGIFLENAFELMGKPGQWYLDRSGVIGGKPSVYYIPRDGESMAAVNAVLGSAESLVSLQGENQNRPIHDVTFQGLVFSHATWFIDRSLAGKVGGYAGLQAGVHLLNKADFLKADASSSPDELVAPASEVGGFYDPVNLAYEAYVPGSVTVNFANRIAFVGNTFTHLGATALAMVRGIQNSQMTGNVFNDISGSAIQLGGVEQEDHHPCGDVPTCDNGRVTENNVIANNRISDTAVEFLDTVGIFVGYTRNTSITNNELFDLSYTGITIGWGWGWFDQGAFFRWKNPTIAGNNHIVKNRITRFLTRQRDGAAIYTLGSQPGSIIAENFATDGKNDFAGIYQDEGSSGFTVEKNVVTKVKNFVLINCNKNDVTSGNVYRENFSETGTVRNGCAKGKNDIATPLVFTDRFTKEESWPADVRAITEASGLEAEFKKHGKVTSVALDGH